jgi:hypothetical protein
MPLGRRSGAQLLFGSQVSLGGADPAKEQW